MKKFSVKTLLIMVILIVSIIGLFISSYHQAVSEIEIEGHISVSGDVQSVLFNPLELNVPLSMGVPEEYNFTENDKVMCSLKVITLPDVKYVSITNMTKIE